VQEYVRKYGAEIASLGCAMIKNYGLARLNISRLQKSFHKKQKTGIFDTDFQKLHHPCMGHIIKEAFDVRLNYMIDVLCPDHFVHRTDSLMATPLRPKTIGIIQKIGLIDRL
jgi:hypothetical protein